MTLWFLKEKALNALKSKDFNNRQNLKKSVFFYRPSFGRKGGKKNPSFGEFDFVMFTTAALYLGESKWDKSKEIKNNTVELVDVQKNRYEIFKRYIFNWLNFAGNDWNEFKEKLEADEIFKNLKGKVPSRDTVMAKNLKYILENVKKFYGEHKNPKIYNLILCFYNENSKKDKVVKNKKDGQVLIRKIKYNPATGHDGFVEIKI